MKTWMKVLVVTLLFAVPAFALGPILFPPAHGSPEPTAGQLPFFILLAAITSVTSGLGIAFLIFGFPSIRRFAAGSKFRAWGIYLSISWLLTSWWIHDNLHIHNGSDMQGLLYIEYGFHVTLMIAGLVLAYSLLSLIRERSERSTDREISAQRAEAL